MTLINTEVSLLIRIPIAYISVDSLGTRIIDYRVCHSQSRSIGLGMRLLAHYNNTDRQQVPCFCFLQQLDNRPGERLGMR